MQQYIYEKDGRKRKASKIVCSICNKEFLRANKNIKENNYCSRTCVYKSQEVLIVSICDYCKKEFKRNPNKKNKYGFYFCSRKCKENAQSIYGGDRFISMRPNHYENGDSNYQDRAYKEYGEICNRCGYLKNKAALHVHHIDRDRTNNSINNLEVLCANCHAIEHWG